MGLVKPAAEVSRDAGLEVLKTRTSWANLEREPPSSRILEMNNDDDDCYGLSRVPPKFVL